MAGPTDQGPGTNHTEDVVVAVKGRPFPLSGYWGRKAEGSGPCRGEKKGQDA